MSSFILYLVKVNSVLLLFAIAYFLVLRNLTFYKVNRFFLLCGLIFSSVYPFIDLTNLFYSQKSINTDWIQYVPETSLKELGTPGLLWQILAVVFYAGMIVMAIRFLGQIISLRKIHSRSRLYPNLGKKVRVLNEKVYPFTFWQTIYLNPAMHEDADVKVIMTHEKVHVKQWHTLDILLSQLGGIFYWFNPGIWFMKNFIKENLEFLTDEVVIKKGVEKKVYQYNVLKVEAGISSLTLTSGFNLNGIKRRIRMMNTRQSSRSRLAVYFVLLPVLILFSLAFTISKAQNESTQEIPNRVGDFVKSPETATATTERNAMDHSAEITHRTIKRQTENLTVSDIPKTQKISGIELQQVSGEQLLLKSREPISGMAKPALKENDEVITVIGYPGKIRNQENIEDDKTNAVNRKRVVKISIVKGFQLQKPGEPKNAKIIYYKNGVRIPADEVNEKIKSENIEAVSVQKNKDGSGEVYLKMKNGTEEK